jgi:carboxylesterase
MDLIDPLAAAFRLEGTNGQAAVLVHGFTGTPAHFRQLAAVLNRAGYTVVAPLLAGHGTSIDDLAATGADDWIASVRSAVDEVADHRRIHLAGLSMGGLISLILAGSTGAATVSTINSPIVVRSKTLYLTRLIHRFRPTVEWPDSGPPDLDDEMTPLWITYTGFPTRCAADLVSIMRKALVAARRLDTPSLVIQSRIDESVDPRSARIVARLLGRDCRLVWLERSMHNALLDRERDVIGRAVLDRLADPGRTP